MLESALVAGICSVGAHAVIAGIVPTPAVAYLIRKFGLDAGVVISASHNPVEYNGIKFFNKDGYKLADELENEIEELLFNDLKGIPSPTGKDLGTKSLAEYALDEYIDFLTSTTSAKLDGIKVAIDCANGAAYKAAPIALLNLGAEVCIIHNEPDGNNINDKCGSTHMEDLCAFVKEMGADIGFAFDGDADRCLAVDENGELIDGDKILAICGMDMKNKGTLKNDTVVGTVMTNLGLIKMGEANGIKVEQTAVGDRYVLEKMLKCGYNLGGEQSGHIILLDYATTGDGQLSGAMILSIMKRTGEKLSNLAKVMERMPQVLINVKVSAEGKLSFYTDKEIKAELNRVTEILGDRGRILIRVSGTEPLVRVMLEGENLEEIQGLAEEAANVVRERLA